MQKLKAVAERLTLPVVLVHFFRFDTAANVRPNDCFSNNAPEPATTVTSRNLQVITGRAAREGARERVCFAQKQPIAATEMAMLATQQPQRGGTTSCASRPSAGIDRAKCLISLKATGEQERILCTVTLGACRRRLRTPEGGLAYGT
jgi:hypothetical protein